MFDGGICFFPKTKERQSQKLKLSSETFKTLSQLVSHVAPAAEVEIQTREFGKDSIPVAASDRLSISPSSLYPRLSSFEMDEASAKLIESRMQVLTDGHTVYGRAAICLLASTPLGH